MFSLSPVFFVSCPRLDLTDGITRTILEEALSLAFLEIRLETRRRLFQLQTGFTR